MADKKKLMAAFVMAIARDNLNRQDVAGMVGIEPRRFGEMLRAERPMPLEAREKLLDILNLREVWQRLNSNEIQ